MNWQDRISVDPKVLVGKPVIKGTRIAVEFLLELLAEGWTHEQILQNYPELSPEDIQAALHCATESLKQERGYRPRLLNNSAASAPGSVSSTRGMTSTCSANA
jgi:uncharacterized protein (DUF433 family)